MAPDISVKRYIGTEITMQKVFESEIFYLAVTTKAIATPRAVI